MYKSINILVIFLTMTSSLLITSCQSTSEKVDDAKANVSDAKQDLKEAVKDANTEAIKIADEKEWLAFKEENEIKIKDNEIRVVDLKSKLKTIDRAKDALYSSQIELLEQKNKTMRERMNNYEKNQSDWESFKREFNHDLDELGKALKDFTINNKK